MNLLKEMEESIINMEKAEAARLAKEALKKRIEPITAIEKGFAKGIEEVGRRFEKEKIYLPELIMGAEAMTAAMDILQKAIKEEGKEGPKALGTAIAGTVQGDIHDIGKNIV